MSEEEKKTTTPAETAEDADDTEDIFDEGGELGYNEAHWKKVRETTENKADDTTAEG